MVLAGVEAVKMYYESFKQKNTGRQAAASDLTEVNKLHRRVVYNVSEFLSFVKSKLRYLSYDMLLLEQKSKRETFFETIQYIE